MPFAPKEALTRLAKESKLRSEASGKPDAERSLAHRSEEGKRRRERSERSRETDERQRGGVAQKHRSRREERTAAADRSKTDGRERSDRTAGLRR